MRANFVYIVPFVIPRSSHPIDSTHVEDSEAGLYPFNKQSLWVLYQGLDTTKVAKTPRTFLGSILEYILQSHGAKVKEGQFPPPARELANNVRPPTLNQDAQRRTITRQTPSTAVADRLESLVLFSGDRTINQSTVGGQTVIGSLSEPVFRAFDLPFIEGNTTVTSTNKFPPVVQPKTIVSPAILAETRQISITTTPEPQSIATEQPSSDPIIKDVRMASRGCVDKL